MISKYSWNFGERHEGCFEKVHFEADRQGNISPNRQSNNSIGDLLVRHNLTLIRKNPFRIYNARAKLPSLYMQNFRRDFFENTLQHRIFNQQLYWKNFDYNKEALVENSTSLDMGKHQRHRHATPPLLVSAMVQRVKTWKLCTWKNWPEAKGIFTAESLLESLPNR